MATATRDALRELCGDYYHGLIPTEAYRRRRAAILDAIILREDASADVDRTQPRPAATSPESAPTSAATTAASSAAVSIASTAAAATPEVARAASPPSAAGSRNRIVIGGAVAVGLLLAVVAFLVGRHQSTGQAAPTIAAGANAVAQAPPPAAAPASSSDAYDAFVQRFVDADTWTDGTLSSFLFDWDLLSDAQRAAVRGSESFETLTRKLRSRVLELRALADPSKPATVDRFRLLLSFARELEVDPGVADVETSPHRVAQAHQAVAQAPARESKPPREPLREEVASADTAPPSPAASAVAAAAAEPVAASAAQGMTSGSPSPAEKPAVAQAQTARPAPAQIQLPKPATAQPATGKSSVAQSQPLKPAPAQPPKPGAAQAPTAKLPAPASPAQATVAATPVPSAATADARPVVASTGRACLREMALTEPLPSPDRRACYDMIAEGVRGPTMLVLPPGQFTMGSKESATTSPPHAVKISEPFALAVYETSVGEFRRFCQDKARACPMLDGAQDDYPVVNVTWQDAMDYAAWLSEKTGARYLLPSEAQWEYAARAMTATRYPFGDDIDLVHAVFASGNTTAPLPRGGAIVGNAFGLRHTVGNVREWVDDVWMPDYAGAPTDGSARTGNGSDRVARGGSFNDSRAEVTSASRTSAAAGQGNKFTGFRVMRKM